MSSSLTRVDPRGNITPCKFLAGHLQASGRQWEHEKHKVPCLRGRDAARKSKHQEGTKTQELIGGIYCFCSISSVLLYLFGSGAVIKAVTAAITAQSSFYTGNTIFAPKED